MHLRPRSKKVLAVLTTLGVLDIVAGLIFIGVYNGDPAVAITVMNHLGQGFVGLACVGAPIVLYEVCCPVPQVAHAEENELDDSELDNQEEVIEDPIPDCTDGAPSPIALQEKNKYQSVPSEAPASSQPRSGSSIESSKNGKDIGVNYA